jgi:hypothetical protein
MPTVQPCRAHFTSLLTNRINKNKHSSLFSDFSTEHLTVANYTGAKHASLFYLKLGDEKFKNPWTPEVRDTIDLVLQLLDLLKVVGHGHLAPVGMVIKLFFLCHRWPGENKLEPSPLESHSSPV